MSHTLVAVILIGHITIHLKIFVVPDILQLEVLRYHLAILDMLPVQMAQIQHCRDHTLVVRIWTETAFRQLVAQYTTLLAQLVGLFQSSPQQHTITTTLVLCNFIITR